MPSWQSCSSHDPRIAWNESAGNITAVDSCHELSAASLFMSGDQLELYLLLGRRAAGAKG